MDFTSVLLEVGKGTYAMLQRKQIKDHFPYSTLKTELCIKMYSSEQFIILKEDVNFSLIFSSHLFFFKAYQG